MSVVNVEARNAANRFYRSFPMGYITLEKFDDFIIHSMDVSSQIVAAHVT